MAVNILKTSDFTQAGEFSIGLNTNESPNLLAEIVRVESLILQKLLGARLYNEFQVDLAINNDGTASSTKWIDFLNGVSYIPESDPDITINYAGINRMLMAFVYYYYQRDHIFKRTGTGVVKLNGENSEPVSMALGNALIEAKYNIGVNLYRDSQCFIWEYTEHEVIYDGITESPAGTYEYDLVANPIYIDNGDDFTTQGSTFSVIAFDSSSVIGTSTAGLTLLVDGSILYEPFKDWVQTNLSLISMV